MHTYTHVGMHTHTHTHIHTHTHVHAHMHPHPHAYTHTHTLNYLAVFEGLLHPNLMTDEAVALDLVFLLMEPGLELRQCRFVV